MRAGLQQHFQRVGLRCTTQRLDLLDYLRRNPVHATADEIYEALNRRNPRVSRATVYNCLRDLARSGLVRQVPGEGHAARYDTNLHRHHHFVCDQCGAVEDIAWFDIPVSSWKSAAFGRRVREPEVVLHGLCTECVKAPSGGKY